MLVAASLASLVFGQVIDAERNLWDVLSIAFTLLLAWGFWTGKPWAFSLSFMLASLCVAVTIGVAFIQTFLMELDVSQGLLWTAAISVLWIALLMTPSTKRFAGLDRSHETASV